MKIVQCKDYYDATKISKFPQILIIVSYSTLPHTNAKINFPLLVSHTMLVYLA